MTEDSTFYAIGDIHGRRELLDDLLAAVEGDARAKGTGATIVFTGDYIDRGPNSFGVIERRLIEGPSPPADRFVRLRGIHDELFSGLVLSDTVGEDSYPKLFEHTDQERWRDDGNVARQRKA